MPAEVQERLDYEGKIDRSPRNIESLIALGEASVETFLARREAAISANPRTCAGLTIITPCRRRMKQ
jgi:hypothetical protein